MTSPTDLRTRLAGALALPDQFTQARELENEFNEGYHEGNRQAHSRLAPLHSALADCVGALEEIKDEIERSKKDCLGCANGNDLQDYDICRCCWRVYIGGEKYLIWDWRATERRAEALARLGELLAKGESGK